GHLFALRQQSQVRLFHWRDKEDEVDLIYDHPDQPMAIEITKSKGHTKRGLFTLAARYEKFAGNCFIVSPRSPVKINPEDLFDSVGAIPFNMFLLAVSAHAENELERRLTIT